MPTLDMLGRLKYQTRNALVAVSLIALMQATSSPLLAQEKEQSKFDQDAAPSIEGSWIFKIDRVAQGDSFIALTSFTAGGVVVATGSMDKVNPISPVYGSWRQTGRNGFAVTIYFFVFDPIGNPLGMLKTNESFHFDRQDKLVGSGSSFFCDVDGSNCSNHGTPALINLSGSRIYAEGLK